LFRFSGIARCFSILGGLKFKASSASFGLVIAACLLSATDAQAGEKVDVYHAEALVKNASDSERNRAAQLTLGEVIVRVSGQTSALQNPQVREAIAQAPNYLFGFSYEASSEKLVRDGKTLAAVKLQLNYSPQAIEQLLRKAQLPLWPATRPKLLVWLVAQDQTGFHLIPEITDAASLRAQASLRGLPIQRPAMDLEDSLSINASDLWNLDIEKIRAASLRYKADAILIGRYVPSAMNASFPVIGDFTEALASAGTEPVPMVAPELDSLGVDAQTTTVDGTAISLGPWQSDWLLVSGEQQQSFINEAPEVADLLQSAMDFSADYFASVYGIRPNSSGPQTVVIKIANITRFAAFKQVQAYINDLAMVQHADFMRVSGDGLWLKLTIEGDLRLLMETLALGQRLAPIVTDSIESLSTVAVQAGGAPDYAPATAPDEAAVEASINAEIAREFGLDPEADMAVLNAGPTGQDLAAAAAPAFVPPQAGNAEDPLLYVWQK